MNKLRLVCKMVATVYSVAAALALAFAVAGVYGWFGLARDPFSAVWVLMLGLPWSLVLGNVDLLRGWPLIVSGVAINAALLWAPVLWRPKAH